MKKKILLLSLVPVFLPVAIVSVSCSKDAQKTKPNEKTQPVDYKKLATDAVVELERASKVSDAKIKLQSAKSAVLKVVSEQDKQTLNARIKVVEDKLPAREVAENITFIESALKNKTSDYAKLNTKYADTKTILSTLPESDESKTFSNKLLVIKTKLLVLKASELAATQGPKLVSALELAAKAPILFKKQYTALKASYNVALASVNKMLEGSKKTELLKKLGNVKAKLDKVASKYEE